MVVLGLIMWGNVQAQNPSLPPGSNFDLSIWKITLPDQSEIEEAGLVNGFEQTETFYTDPETGAMVFRCRNDGETGGSTYPRSELREMLRAGNTSISTRGIGKNNWVFSNSSQASQDASGGVDGVLTATVAVDHVSTTGQSSRVGRVIIGQIHASDNEPCRLYYRKLPQNDKGVIYFAHEPNTGSEQWHEMIGSRSSSASNPEDGIALGEVFSYEIKVVGDLLTVTIIREGKPDVEKTIDMSASGFEDDWMYFKAGVYNQNNGGDPGDYCQVSFFALNSTHSNTGNRAPRCSITSPTSGADVELGSTITLTADASDADGTVSQVEFFVDGTSLGVDNAAPYEMDWTVESGTFVLTAVATDNAGAATTSPEVTVTGRVLPANIFVSDLEVTSVRSGLSARRGAATVTIIDDQGVPIENATIIGTFSGAFQESESGTTNSEGMVTLLTSGSVEGEMELAFCVDEVSHATLPYVSALNSITCTELQVITSLPDQGLGVRLRAYPNPVRSFLTLHFGDNVRHLPLTLQLLSTTGSVLTRLSYSAEQLQADSLSIDLSKYPQGIYLLEAWQGGQRHTFRVLKQ